MRCRTSSGPGSIACRSRGSCCSQEKEDPAKHFTLKEIKALSREELAQIVRDRLGASSEFKDQALVFLHGFNNSFESALFRTAQIAYDLKFDGAPFLYSWPSKGQLGLQDYSYDRESSGQSEPYLRRVPGFRDAGDGRARPSTSSPTAWATRCC